MNVLIDCFQLVNGTAIFQVKMEEMEKGLESFWFPDGARLKIEADVLENASGKKEKAIDKNILFAHRPFELFKENSMKYFKPGLQYTLKVHSVSSTSHFIVIFIDAK